MTAWSDGQQSDAELALHWLEKGYTDQCQRDKHYESANAQARICSPVEDQAVPYLLGWCGGAWRFLAVGEVPGSCCMISQWQIIFQWQSRYCAALQLPASLTTFCKHASGAQHLNMLGDPLV
jgi:hypothetical protein